MAIINQIRSILSRILVPNNAPIIPNDTPVMANNNPVVPDSPPVVPDTTPVVAPTPASPDSTAPMIEYNPGVNKNVISVHAIEVITEILKESGNTKATITSSERTPSRQALAMYHNIELKGADAQKRLYGPAGDKVIDVYIQEKAKGKSQDEILAAMVAKIEEVGPSSLSHHLGDFSKLVVVDIAPSSVVHQRAFIATTLQYKQNGIVSQFFYPGNGDPAYHLEIPNKVMG